MAVNAHSIVVARAPAATPTVFTTIAELNGVALPGLSRNEFDASIQNLLLDTYVLGMLRRKPVKLSLNFMLGDATHNEVAGLYSAIIANSFDGYKFTQSTSSLFWLASGQVQAIDPLTPTDGKFAADVTLRFSGPMIIQTANIVT